MYIEEVVWLSSDNTFEVGLFVKKAAIEDHSLITRAQLFLNSGTIDSNINPEFFDLTKKDRIILKLGDAGLALGKHSGKLKTFDADNPSGIVWPTPIVLEVSDV